MSRIIAVDFDGTLCENDWPGIGTPRYEVIDMLIKARKHGDRIILWTCREGQLLQNAITWCGEHGLTFDAVNSNLPERIEMFGNDSRKISADVYLDDRALTPERLSVPSHRMTRMKRR